MSGPPRTPAGLATAHPFVVGNQYENRKGVYEVVSIHGDQMTIRWDTGEECTLPIELQAKILRNMENELRMPFPAKGYRAPRAYGDSFAGLRAGDFADTVTGTCWRSREQLGGAVTRLLNVREPYDSWSIYRRAQVHWESVARHGLADAWHKSKFFVHVTTRNLDWGVYLEHSASRNDNWDDWMRFLAWVENADHSRWLHQTMFNTCSTMDSPWPDEPNQAFYGRIIPLVDGSFCYSGKDAITFAAVELAGFLGSLPEGKVLNLIINRTIPCDEAVARGPRIASEIAEYFNLLLPVYESRNP